jgi:hypothetical protein
MQDTVMDQHEEEGRNDGESNCKQDDEVVIIIIQLYCFVFVAFFFLSLLGKLGEEGFHLIIL